MFVSPKNSRRHLSKSRSNHLLRVEQLEDRRLLATFTVLNTMDSGAGSLRQAITDANANLNGANADEIHFAIPTSDPGYDVVTGAYSIRPGSALPLITDPLVIDGWTQPGWNRVPIIELEGSNIAASVSGLTIGTNSPDSTIRGLVVNRFLRSQIEVAAPRAVVQGNYVGTDVTGTVAASTTSGMGIFVEGSIARDVRIGTNGDGNNDLAERNIISGNSRGIDIRAYDTLIGGNFIGTDVSGSFAVPNRTEGIIVSASGTVLIGTNGDGVADEIERNIVSGNNNGVRMIQNSGGVIAGNFIGTDVTGTQLIANTSTGISFEFSSTPLLIGTDADGVADEAERNIIVGGIGTNGASNMVVAGNYLGTDVSGTVALGPATVIGLDGFTPPSTFIRIGTNGDGVHDEVERNVLSGIYLNNGANNNVIAGNYIGTDATGSYALRSGPYSGGNGVMLLAGAHDNRIGTNGDGVSDELERNVIAGVPGDGVRFHGSGDHNQVTGNYIGTNVLRESLGNSGSGVYLSGVANNNQIGGEGPMANLIAHNSSNGVVVLGEGAVMNSIRGNSIRSNTGLGIELDSDNSVTPNDQGDADTGPNNLQNYPELASVIGGASTNVAGTLNSLPNTSFLIDLYANTVADPSGHGEGERWLGVTTVKTDANGDASFSVTLASATAAGEYITATATRLEDHDSDPTTPLLETDTSEFSAVLLVPANQPPTISAQSFSLDENQLVVGTVLASDDDLPEDSLSFSITGNGPDDAKFAISASGGLSFLVAPDFENPTDVGGSPGDNVYLVEVQVTDAANATATATMSVTVNNITATINGTVFVDANNNGLFDGGSESAIDAVLVELLNETGAVLDSDTTAMGGVYAFEVDDEFATYRIRETQPSGVDDGQAILGDANGNSITGEAVDGLILSTNEMQLTLTGIDASDYDFAEAGQSVQAGDTATIGFWQNRHGQALIEQGGPQLVNWLNTNFGNIFGSTFSDGSGGDDAREVADFYKNEFFKKKLQGTSKVDAQFMALALSTFFTSSNLSGGSTASGFGFNVTETGIGTKVVNVGSSGQAFNVADNSDATIMSLLLATNSLTGADADLDASEDYSHVYDLNGDGILDEYEKSLRAMANAVYTLVNESGDI